MVNLKLYFKFTEGYTQMTLVLLVFDLVSHSTNRERERKRESERVREKVGEAQVRDQQIDTHVTPSVMCSQQLFVSH